MRGLTLPLILAVAAVIITFIAYRNIRRGGARFYTLEREAILRQASYLLMLAMALFTGAVVLLSMEIRQRNAEDAAASGQVIEGVATSTPPPTISQFPPTPTATATPDPNIPTITPTPILRRALVDGTGGNGLYLRREPNGETITILPDGTFVTLLDEPPVPGSGFNWVKVRTTVGGDEGWVADLFLVTSDNQ